MEQLTLGIGLAAAAVVLLILPRHGFIVYLVTLLFYPAYLRIVVFGCTVSVGRLVVAALFVRCLVDKQLLRSFKWTRLDTLIVIADAVYLLVLCCGPAGVLAGGKHRAGLMLDTIVVYFATRLIINNRAILTHIVKVAAVVLVIMAAMGAVEAATTATPYKGLLAHHFHVDRDAAAYKFEDQEVVTHHGHEVRLGFFRAQGAHPHPIIFGAVFALLLPLVWKVLYHTKWRHLRKAVCGLLVLGGASSLSSTSYVGVFVALAGLGFERLKRWMKPLAVLAVLSCLFLELYTDRSHFYHVFLGRLTIQSGTGYARGKLIDLAMEDLPKYWLTGYGFNDPGWGEQITGADFTDVTVHYVYLAVLYGIFGLLAYLTIVFYLLLGLWRRYRRSVETFDQNLCWALLVSIVVILTLDWGVTPFGVLPALYSIIFGIAASVVSRVFERQFATANTHGLLVGSVVS